MRRLPRLVPQVSLEREVDRSRRFGQPTALLRVTPEARLSFRGRAHPPNPVRLATRLGRMLRTIDVVWVSGRDVYVVLPGTDRRALDAVIARVGAEAPELTAVARIAGACFPEDGLTADALRSCVRDGGRSDLVGTPRREAPVRAPGSADAVVGSEHA